MAHTIDSPLLTPSLGRFIDDVAVLTPAAGATTPLQWLPDGRTRLVFRLHDGASQADLSVGGPRTRALYKDSAGLARVVILQFRTGRSAPLLGVSASALTDRMVSLEELWGPAGADLCADLLAAQSLAQVGALLSRAIDQRSDAAEESNSARLARRAARLFEGGEARVDAVAEQLGITPRHLRRTFTESVGIGPKEFARTARLQRAVRMAKSSSDWAHIAVDAGYHDQAHLIAEFRDLVGFTPTAFLRQRRVQGIAPQQPATQAR